jgi:hypothetical protein
VKSVKIIGSTIEGSTGYMMTLKDLMQELKIAETGLIDFKDLT